MRKAVLAGVAAVWVAGAAVAAPTGAPQDETMQAGGWTPGGWQSGAPTGQPGAPMGEPGAMPPPAMVPPAPMGSPPMAMHGDYRPVHPGQHLKGQWRDPSLTVTDWQAWGLGQPGAGMRWIRYYDDAVLVDADDRVVTARGGIAWDAPRRGYGYHGGMGPGWHHPPFRPGITTYRAGPNTTVTTQVIAPPPIVYGGGYAPGYGAGYGYDGGYAGGYGYAGGGSTVIVSPGVVTTTTTTTTERMWHKVRVRRGCGCAAPIHQGKLVRR
jgi:Ni/Co efflux regulator RcnB